MSPRRSSRSKTAQLVPNPQQASSSSSSVSSGRADRSSRSNNKISSPRSSLAPRSPFSEDRETSSKPQTNRTRGSQDNGPDRVENVYNDGEVADDDDEPDDDEEEEVTRCICGQMDYPGMPNPIQDLPQSGSRATSDAKEGTILHPLPEDAGGLFIQCDICKVWQHGGCVGIMDEAMSPDEYFCEQCRKDLHKITVTANGQQYSIYLPVQGSYSSRSSPSATPQVNTLKKAKDGRSNRPGTENQPGKRRSTMNSRDAAYDEAEQLRRAIEESKEGTFMKIGAGTRKGKRSRDESEQRKDDPKRQRTNSDSSEDPTKENQLNNSGDEAESRKKSIEVSRNIRSGPARNHRTKDFREQEEQREKARADAAGRRKGRAERRRGDEEPLSRTTSSKGADQSLHNASQMSTNTPIASQEQLPTKMSNHKKTGRPPTRRGRVGRNQYTRDRDLRTDAVKNARDATSPTRSNNSKEGHESPHVNGNDHWNSEFGRSSKAKHVNLSRITMNDMKRRVALILDFISHIQVEMAAEVPLTPPSRNTPSTNAPGREHETPQQIIQGTEKSSVNTENEHQSQEQSRRKDPDAELEAKHFAELPCLEMMEVLTRRLIKWQGEYGKYGEK